MTPSHEQAKTSPEAYIKERLDWMQEAIAVLGAEPGSNPLEVLPAATEPRDAADALPLSEEQETQLREVAGRFGIGGEADVVTTAQVQILEGGKPWKVEAEAEIAGNASTIIFAGSPNRVIGQDESDYMREKHGHELVGSSELDMVRSLAEKLDGFTPLPEEEVLPFGYEVSETHDLVSEPTGQLVKTGEVSGKSVLILRVDRENYTDDKGETKYRNQPDSAALMGFVDRVLTASGDESSAVGLNTSTTYASRAVDTVRAGLKSGRFFDVGMYGRQTLADVRGTEAAEPTGINQIPGELHAMYEKLVSLQAELDQTA